MQKCYINSKSSPLPTSKSRINRVCPPSEKEHSLCFMPNLSSTMLSMSSSSFFFTILPLLVHSAPFSSRFRHPDPIVHTSHAIYLGRHEIPGVEAFLGIPYAEPPVGNLRFQSPEPLNNSICTDREGAERRPNLTFKPATSLGPVCHQVHYDSVLGPVNLRETTAQDEDCLTVNVWRPMLGQNEKGEKLPVMVWIHGGTFSEGGGSVPSKFTYYIY